MANTQTIKTDAIMVKTDAINERIRLSGIKLCYIADALGIHEDTLRRKIRNEQEFKITEMVKISCILNLSDPERDFLFSLNG